MSKLFDRSRVTTDWKCRRRRFLNYEADGIGLQPPNAAYELYFGTLVHDALAAIAQMHQLESGVDIDAIVAAGTTQLHTDLMEGRVGEEAEVYANEQCALFEGMIRGFYRLKWPDLLSTYPTIVTVEQEVVTPYNFMVKPDLILQDPNGMLVYVEYKTTGSNNEKWVESWQLNPQLHSYMKAIRDATGLEIAAALVIGLYKGYVRAGRQTSPFCYAHGKQGQPPFFEPELLYTYKAGYRKIPTWELEGGLKKWVDEMPLDILSEQIIGVPPIYYNAEIGEAFFRQALVREKEIALTNQLLQIATDWQSRQAIMDATFPQNFEACTPSFGSPCPFRDICHPQPAAELVGLHPFDLGYTYREPHHAPEIEELKAKNLLTISENGDIVFNLPTKQESE